MTALMTVDDVRRNKINIMCFCYVFFLLPLSLARKTFKTTFNCYSRMGFPKNYTYN